MANDTADVTMRAPSGKQYTVPRGNLAKAKALGWMEVTTEPEVAKESLFDVFGTETARGMGLDPEKIKRLGGKSLGKQTLEAGREVLSGVAPFMERVAKDPFKITEPFESAATGIEKGVGSIWDVLTTGDRKDPDLLRKFVAAGGKLTGGLAGAAALGEAPEGAEVLSKTPRSIVKGAKTVAEGPKELLRTGMGAGERSIQEAKAEIGKVNEAKIAKQQAVQAENAKVTQARQTLQKKSTESAKAFTQNLDLTTKYIKAAFDSEYEEFDARVLGKTPQNPKGTLPADISPVANAVQDAKKNLIEGTEESNKQFDSIMQRIGKDRVDLGGGQLGPVPGQMIPAADLRGYITELESKVYDSNLLPDVRQAVKSVIEVGKKQVSTAIENAHGPQVVKLYKDLNSRYSDYLTDWRDSSKVNSLPALRNILYEGVVQKNPEVLANLDLAKKVPEGRVQAATTLLKKYEKYGAKPELLQEYRKTLEQMKALPKPKNVPEVVPKKFERGEFVRKKVEGRADQLVRYSVIWPVVEAIHAATKLEIPSIESMLMGPAGALIISNMLKSPKFIEWLAREKAKGAVK